MGLKAKNLYVGSTREFLGGSLPLHGSQEDVLQVNRATQPFQYFDFDVLPAQSCVLDVRGKIISVNKAWLEMSGSDGHQSTFFEANYLETCEKTVGTDLEFAQKAHAGISDILAGRSNSFLMEYPCPTSEKILYFNCRAVGFEQNGERFVLVMHEDVTQLRQARENEFRAREELMRALFREQRARREAEAANRHREDFLANLSHELRTPLGAILGFSELLNLENDLNPDMQMSVDAVNRNAVLLKELVDQLMDAAHIAGGKLQLENERVELNEVLETAVESFQIACSRKCISILRKIPDEKCWVSGDRVHLTQVVWNFLSNAVKFTERGGTIEVNLHKFPDTFKVTVTDNGSGIDPRFLPHVFERFRQEESGTSRKHGGLGLGLSIVKQIVEMHKGTVKIWSEGAGKGTVAEMELPALANG